MKSIPIALQVHYDADACTTCQLTRVETKDGTVYGFTDLDADVVYDDGGGSVTYRAENGFTPSRQQASADMAVDNSELAGIVSDTGITMQQIRAGLFDFAHVRIYRVNYMDLSQGHEIIATGTAGETRFSDTGFRVEFRSLTQQTKQPISPAYSLTCRARFGSKAISTNDIDSSGTASFEEAHPCGMDFTWYGGAVTSVGTSLRTTFTDTGLSQADSFFTPGVVEWLTGSNAGAQMEVDEQTNDSSGKSVRLALPMPYAIQVGDTYRIRQDCNKVARDETHGCKYHWGADWIYHFQGEPDIPVSDGGANMIPGAQITRS
jgi:uncharacterized phage protein (TIGR02218 family)